MTRQRPAKMATKQKRLIEKMKMTLEEIKHTLQLRMFLNPDVVER